MNCVRWKIAIAIIYKCMLCLKIKFLKSLFQRIAYLKEPSCLYHYLANKMSYISGHHNSMNHDMYSRNSMKLCNLHKEKITPWSVSKANIKFCSLNVRRIRESTCAHIQTSSPSRKPVECSRRMLHISWRLVPERDATAAKLSVLVVRSSLDENTAC